MLFKTIVVVLLIVIVIQETIQMATSADVSAQFDSIDTAINKLGTDMQQAFVDLEAKIAAGGSTEDLQPLVDRGKAVAAKLAEFDSAALSADPGPAEVTATPPDVTVVNGPITEG